MQVHYPLSSVHQTEDAKSKTRYATESTEKKLTTNKLNCQNGQNLNPMLLLLPIFAAFVIVAAAGTVNNTNNCAPVCETNNKGNDSCSADIIVSNTSNLSIVGTCDDNNSLSSVCTNTSLDGQAQSCG